ncbi:hypothetical protein PJP07_30940, partial [Mycobacterium kansasii]
MRQTSTSPIPEKSQAASSSKGKQIAIEEVDEEILEDENSTSSSSGTASQYEDDEDVDSGENRDDDFEEG